MCTGTHPFIPAVNAARSRMVYNEFGNELMNVFTWVKDSPFSSSDLAALDLQISSSWQTTLKTRQTQDITLSLINSIALDVDGGPEDTLGVGLTGSIGNAGLPAGLTLAVKFATGLSGRSHRGRAYFCGLCDNQVVTSSNDIDPSAAAAIRTAYEDFFTDVTGHITGLKHVIASYCKDGVWRTSAQLTPVVSYLLTDDHIDSQRRRLTGRGA